MPIESATRAVRASRQRHFVELIEKTRLRRLVDKIDVAIALCEETHLQGIKEVTPEIADHVRQVFNFGRRAVMLSGDEEALDRVDDYLARRRIKITEVMDVLWSIQETVFDIMQPWRTELPEDNEDGGDTNGIWRAFQAIG